MRPPDGRATTLAFCLAPGRLRPARFVQDHGPHREGNLDAFLLESFQNPFAQLALDEELIRLIADLESFEQQSARARLLQSTGTTRSTIALLALGAILQLVLLGSVYYLIHHDITNRRRVAAELRRQGELLQAANKELEAFSYSVSHDLRAPLRHIDGYAALLSKTAGQSLNDKAQRYLQTISESAKQMGQLIDDLLVFSRMGRQEMLRSTVNLNQLVKTVIHDLRLDLHGRTISWTIGSLPDVPGDPAGEVPFVS